MKPVILLTVRIKSDNNLFSKDSDLQVIPSYLTNTLPETLLLWWLYDSKRDNKIALSSEFTATDFIVSKS